MFAICVVPPLADERANARLGSSRGGVEGIGVSDGSLGRVTTSEDPLRAICSARVVTLVEGTLASTSVAFGIVAPMLVRRSRGMPWLMTVSPRTT